MMRLSLIICITIVRWQLVSITYRFMHLQSYILTILKKCAKTLNGGGDGGDLRNVAYYDERGNLIYAVYDYYDNNCGKLYISGSQRYMEHPFSNSGNSREHLLPVSLLALSTSEVASKYKTN